MTTSTKTPRRPRAMADLTAKERLHVELCVHEAAHAVTGVTLGAQLRTSVVVRSRIWPPEGLTCFESRDFPEHRNAEIAYSGPYGQAKFRAGGRRPSQQQVFSVLRTCGYKDDRVLTASTPADGVHTGRDVVPLLNRCWPAVLRVAQQLARTGEVHQADVLAALGVDDGGGLTSVQLASLRSGLRTVPPIAAKQPAPA